MAWHDEKCAKLELRWKDELPSCATCNRQAPPLIPAQTLPPPAPPSNTRRADLLCIWPPCLEFTPYATGNVHSPHPPLPPPGRSHLRLLENNETKRLVAKVRDVINALEPGSAKASSTARFEKSSQPSTPTSSRSSTVYSTLSQTRSFRLLRLYGSQSPEDPIHCSLEVYDLLDPCLPIFEALSYTWADANGDDSLCQYMFVGSDYDTILITRNCKAALRCFRGNKERLLWVDSICIDQLNHRERAEQVSLMPIIYSEASRVLMYLGESDTLTDRTMETLRQYELGRSRVHITPDSLKRVTRRKYFTRTWMVQEVLLAKTATVTIGQQTIRYDILRLHVAAPEQSATDQQHETWVERDQLLKGSAAHDRHSQWKADLLNNLCSIRNCQCGDPRDQVYAVVGLADEERNDLPVDYSITVQQLYTGLALYWLAKQEYTFLDAIGPAKAIPHLPSWVPDWTSISTWTDPRTSVIQSKKYQIGKPDLNKCISGMDWCRLNTNTIAFEQRIDHRFWSQFDPSTMVLWAQNQVHPGSRSWIRAAFSECEFGNPMSVGREMGFLVVEAFPLFAYSREDEPMRFKAQRDFLYLDGGEQESEFRLCCNGTNDSSSDLHPFVILHLRRAFLLRQHAESIYSVVTSFEISATFTVQSAESSTVPRMSPSPPLPFPSSPSSSSSSSSPIPKYLRRPPPPPPRWFAPGTDPRIYDTEVLRKRLETLETSVVNQWLMDVFYFGNRLSSGSPTFNVHFERSLWSKWFPEATQACRLIDAYPYQGTLLECNATQREEMAALRASVLQIMSRLALADMEHVTSTVSFRTNVSRFKQKSLLFWAILETKQFNLQAILASTPDGLDERLASEIENKCRSTRKYGPSSVDELIDMWSRHIQGCADQCKEFGSLDTALKHVNKGQLKPKFRIFPGSDPPDSMPDAKQIRDSMYAFLCPVIDISEWSKEALDLSLGFVLHKGYSILKGLSIEPDLTGDQYCTLMWMHIVTLDIATRLRGMLHQRRTAQCFDESAKNIERIILI